MLREGGSDNAMLSSAEQGDMTKSPLAASSVLVMFRMMATSDNTIHTLGNVTMEAFIYMCRK